MNRRGCGVVMVVVGVALFAVPRTRAQEDFAERIDEARDAARANAESPEGREWKRDSSSAAGRLMILVLNRCLPEPSGDVPTPFSVFLRFSKKSGVREVITDLDPSLEECMTAAARDLPFPEAPRDDYWVQVNMAVPR
jgi:hypothetical protein